MESPSTTHQVEIWQAPFDPTLISNTNVRLYRMQKRIIPPQKQSFNDFCEKNVKRINLNRSEPPESKAPPKLSSQVSHLFQSNRKAVPGKDDTSKITTNVPVLRLLSGKRVFPSPNRSVCINIEKGSSEHFKTSYTCMSADLEALITARRLKVPSRLPN